MATADAAAARDFKGVVIPPGNTYSGNNDSGSIAGSYRDVAGTFKCSDSCGATGPPARRSDGTIITMAGTWTFEPTDKEARVPEQDDDYLAFGYWLSKTRAGDPSKFEVWYHGTKAVTGADGSSALYDALDEEVTYTGVAGGKYVTKDELTATAEAGYFTADATLTADFSVEDDTTTGDVTEGPTLTGTISGFKDPHGGAPLEDLELTLESAFITYTQATATDSATAVVAGVDATDATMKVTEVTATLGGRDHDDAGGWEAALFGAEKNTNLPTGVVGSFDATVGERMTVMGGFAAEKE